VSTIRGELQAVVEVFILDHLYQVLPMPPFTADETEAMAKRIYQHVWQQTASGMFIPGSAA
jgi:type I restriction enzyme, R subunit